MSEYLILRRFGLEGGGTLYQIYEIVSFPSGKDAYNYMIDRALPVPFYMLVKLEPAERY